MDTLAPQKRQLLTMTPLLKCTSGMAERQRTNTRNKDQCQLLCGRELAHVLAAQLGRIPLLSHPTATVPLMMRHGVDVRARIHRHFLQMPQTQIVDKLVLDMVALQLSDLPAETYEQAMWEVGCNTSPMLLSKKSSWPHPTVSWFCSICRLQTIRSGQLCV